MKKIIPFEPRSREAIIASSENGYIYVEPYYADYLQTSVKDLTDPEVEEIIHRMNEAGFLKEKPKHVAVFDEDTFAVLRISYENNNPSKYLLNQHTRIYTIDQALDIIGDTPYFTSNKVISLSPEVMSLGGNSTYYPRIRKDEEPYKELQRFAGQMYDGSLNIEKLEPFKGKIYGVRDEKNRTLRTRIYDYYCNGKKCDDNTLVHDSNHSRIANDSNFVYSIASVEHKAFEKIENNEDSFMHRLEVKLNY
jgi:hypothetical protein